MGPSFLEALLGGRPFIAEGIGGFSLPAEFPDEHDRRFLELRLNQVRENPELHPWLPRAMVLRREPQRPMAGHIGFHQTPRGGGLEMGYTVFPRYRRQGYAQEAIQALMHWAWDEFSVSRFRLSISPENRPSLALAAKLGFERTGEQMDPEDGLEYVFERDYNPSFGTSGPSAGSGPSTGSA
jgi:RimJ/RimL family protein N-acetyltransferase